MSYETPILEVIFLTLTEKSSVVTNGTQGPKKYPHHLEIAVGTTRARFRFGPASTNERDIASKPKAQNPKQH